MSKEISDLLTFLGLSATTLTSACFGISYVAEKYIDRLKSYPHTVEGSNINDQPTHRKKLDL